MGAESNGLTPGVTAVIERLRDGWEWPHNRRADGWRYWLKFSPAGYEPLTEDEMAVVDAFDREHGNPDPYAVEVRG